MQETSVPPVSRHLTGSQTEDSFTQHVNNAFKNYHSVLALSRSPLANSHLVTPALVRDAVSPSADERGSALRLVLQWAVSLLAPEPPRFPLGTPRPYDDPAWRDPRWWRYNILRHRYLEPLHPDEFVEGGRYTETLIALTGIPNADAFFDERNRAIGEIAAWLRQQLVSGAANDVVRQMALVDTLRLVEGRPDARALLDVAATFEGVFPRILLVRIAEDERVVGIEPGLAYLTTQRLLLTDNLGADLWLSPVLQAYLYDRQPEERRARRHHHIARYYAETGEPLQAAEHWQKAGQWPAAARILFAAAADLVNELQISDLRDVLRRFEVCHLPPDQWHEVQILLCDLSLRLGQREEALSACRQALKATRVPQQQARIYRRMGKLYEQHNQLHALGYYQQAEERFDAAAPELMSMLKDRAWLYILRREWSSAEADLARALERTPEQDRELRADIYDALANLHRHQHHFERAVVFAQQALALREEQGNLPRIADSFNNLGLLYSAMADYPNALAAFAEALAVFRRVGNQERTALGLLNIGVAHHLAGRRREAIAAYRECLAICEQHELRLAEVRAHYNLAEAFAELGENDMARTHWRAGHHRSLESSFDDEVRDLEVLRAQFPALQEAEPSQPPLLDIAVADVQPVLDTEARLALSIAEQAGRVTPKALMAAANISKPTATRRLADLVQRGYLHPQGRGRATAYTLAPPAMPYAGHSGPNGAALHQPPGSARVPAHMVHTLRTQLPMLAQSYDIKLKALGIAEQNQPGADLRLLVQFARVPDLPAFFALERRLGTLLGCRIDLMPADSAGPDCSHAPVEWLRFDR